MKQVDIMIARFPGNNQEHPESVNWVLQTALAAQKDERINRVVLWHKADTPIDMVRNECVEVAQQEGVDFLFMIDNDMTPDTAGGGKFFDTAMDFLYGKIEPSCIAAPYVGGGEFNNIFVFLWKNVNNGPNPNYALQQYDREHAAEQRGIGEVAALPTGLIAYDMRVFDRLKATGNGYFYYEFNTRRTAKQSTEDVTNTRDISLAWADMPGAGCFCAWDCWASHNKIVPCGKPRPASPLSVGDTLYHVFKKREANMTSQVVDVGATDDGIRVADLVSDLRGNGAIQYADEKTIQQVRKQVESEFSEHVNGSPCEI